MLERLQVVVRLRGNWEALDLGACLLRRYGTAVYAVWLPLVGTFALLLAVFLHRWPWTAVLAFWWCKPLYDRLVLHVLGRATFGTVPTLRQTMRELPTIFRHGSLASLLWRRLSPQRSYLLPIWQLEDQPGPDFRRRARPLLRRGRGTAQVLTLGCIHFEWIVQLGVLVALQLMVPRGSDFNVFQQLQAGGEGPTPPWLAWLVALLPFLSATVIEPYYVAAGFGLYLNRRVQLEGWDLELAFRKLAARLLRPAALLLLFLVVTPMPAQEPITQARIEAVLKAPEFQTSRLEKGLRWKQRKKEPPAQQPKSPRFEALGKGVAQLVKWTFILAAAAMVGWFLWRLRDRFGSFHRGNLAGSPPESFFGLDLRPESLPPDVAGAARALFQAGRFRAALGLLYRASLARLVAAHGMEMAVGATEAECLRRADEVLPPESSAFFHDLTRAWQAAAYAHRPPADGEALCQRWSAVFAGTE